MMDRKWRMVFLAIFVVWTVGLVCHTVWWFVTPGLPSWQAGLLGVDALAFVGYILFWAGMSAPATE